MPMLAIDRLCAGYGPIRVLQGISLHVDEGEVVALIGANGAGKSTTLRAVSGLIRPASGSVLYRGRNITKTKSFEIARMGISHVPEGRGIFGNLTVMENLRLATYATRTSGSVPRLINGALELFPVLGQRRTQLASTLSGGEQQMLAIGRALVSDGDLFMLDEPSMGLSPLLVKSVFAAIAKINKQGKTILLVEQNAVMALKCAHRAYVIENGSIVADGTGGQIAADERVKRAYLG
jgi:branched-chain amino acid transport system ATP-binding protein